MPIQLEFVHDGLGVIYRCEGTLGLQHFSVANDQLLAAPERMRKLKYAHSCSFDGGRQSGGGRYVGQAQAMPPPPPF